MVLCWGKINKQFSASMWSTLKGLCSSLLCFLGCSSQNKVEGILDEKKMIFFFLTFSHFYEVGEKVACASAGIFPGVYVRTSNRENKLVLEITMVFFCC